ncbi:MAG: hypothetical protein JWN40_279 [Phycisphaerales bacterium]|nr:hypothetical protein [Phycisphaerales bacterium]
MKSGNDELFRRGKSTTSKHGPESDLAAKIRQLQADRQQHAQAINEIDQVLHRVENALAELKAMTTRSSGHVPSHAAADTADRPRRHYQKFELTGEESVLDFIRREGHPSTAEINNNWHAQGRTGVANPILARLLKRGLLERESDPTVRGSRYRLTPQPADAPH